MGNIKIKRALISVFKKDGVVEFAKRLKENNVEIISTSKTAKMIKDAGVSVTEIKEVTSFPEIMGGRVKTLHPNIFAGILARRDNEGDTRSLRELKIEPIDLVVVNLYPFEETVSKPDATLDEAIENIDIGGPSMIRAAAKNSRYVAVVTDPGDYESVAKEIAQQGGVTEETSSALALKAFKCTFNYDGHISDYLEGYNSEKTADHHLPESMEIHLKKVKDLRYGENPHQAAALYLASSLGSKDTLAAASPIQGKEISYNNLMDAQGAVNIVRDLSGKYVCAIIKHTNPCGVGRSDKSPLEAYKRALECDPVSAFGGIVCLNCSCDADLALEIKKLFTEVVIAPEFTDDALASFKKKKNLRLIQLDPTKQHDTEDLKIIDGGILMQDMDTVTDDLKDARIVTKVKPSEEEMNTLRFAMNICKNVKSNAIVLANDYQSVGIGAGQTSRVDSCKIALMKANIPTKGAVLASDAFFPFRDSIDLMAKEGIKAVIQPGGSMRDEEVIEACNEHEIAMVFTGKRHFKH